MLDPGPPAGLDTALKGRGRNEYSFSKHICATSTICRLTLTRVVRLFSSHPPKSPQSYVANSHRTESSQRTNSQTTRCNFPPITYSTRLREWFGHICACMPSPSFRLKGTSDKRVPHLLLPKTRAHPASFCYGKGNAEQDEVLGSFHPFTAGDHLWPPPCQRAHIADTIALACGEDRRLTTFSAVDYRCYPSGEEEWSKVGRSFHPQGKEVQGTPHWRRRLTETHHAMCVSESRTRCCHSRLHKKARERSEELEQAHDPKASFRGWSSLAPTTTQEHHHQGASTCASELLKVGARKDRHDFAPLGILGWHDVLPRTVPGRAC